MATMNLEINLLMQRVKTQTVIFYPFFASLALHMPVYETDRVPTMATDGVNVLYNQDWVEKVRDSDGEAALVGVYVHEVMHAALLHTSRGKTYIHEIFNMACDYVVNNMITNSKLTMPQGVLINHEWDDLSAEQIYYLLLKEIEEERQDESGSGSGDGSGSGSGDGSDSGSGGGPKKKQKKKQPRSGSVIDDHSQWGKASASEIERLNEQWKQRLASAVVAAKMQGTLPAGMERLINEVLHPKVDWVSALRNFIQPSAVDYAWNPPDRRFQDEDIAMPDLSGETVDSVFVAVDTSGSISDEMMSQFMGEVVDIVQTWPSMTGWLISCDADIGDIVELNGDFVPRALNGGGGTDFRPVFEKIEAMDTKPTCLIYLTDTYGSFPDYSPDYPVLWCVVNAPEGHVPWGERIDIQV